MKAYIAGSKHPLPAPDEIPKLMKNFVATLKHRRRAKHPVELAASAHKELVFIHPFVDGNGGVGRLLMNLILLQAGFTITIIPPAVRPDYLQTLEKAHTSDSDFIKLIARMVRETQKDFLRLFK